MRNEKGQFQKGFSGNPEGKPTGLNSNSKEWLDTFFEGDKAKAIEDWEKLSPSQRWTIRSKFWDFQMPKLRSEYVSLDIDSMSDQTAGGILAELISKYVENHEIKYQSSDGGDNDRPANN